LRQAKTQRGLVGAQPLQRDIGNDCHGRLFLNITFYQGNDVTTVSYCPIPKSYQVVRAKSIGLELFTQS
jgi:hypothetical protein